MRPNTPHFVVTPESAICHGGHFYAMSTIQDTVFGLYHMFVASTRVTNTEHSEDAHLLLRRMVVYLHYVFVKRGSKVTDSTSKPPPISHVPNLSTFEGALDLFMLCIIMELGDLINPLAYKKTYRQARHHSLRVCTIHARGLSRDLRNWWDSCYIFLDPETRMLHTAESVFKNLLSQHLSTLVFYKKMAEENDVRGEVPECTAKVLQSLLQKYLPYALYSPCHRGFEWGGAMYVVQARAPGSSAYMRSWNSAFFPHDVLTIHCRP